MKCKRCFMEVEDTGDNRTFNWNQLMCPSCRTFLNDDFELFNSDSMKDIGHPLIDHLRYDKKTGLIKIHPYSSHSEDLLTFLLEARRLGYHVTIYGRGEHHEDCFTITFIKNTRIALNRENSIVTDDGERYL